MNLGVKYLVPLLVLCSILGVTFVFGFMLSKQDSLLDSRMSTMTKEEKGAIKFAFGSTSFLAALQLMKAGDGAFIDHLDRAIVETTDGPVYWECKPYILGEDSKFEFVVIPAPGLELDTGADLNTFKEHFDRAKNIDKKTPHDSISFQNVGGKSTLIAPMPGSGPTAHKYTHLKGFLRSADSASIIGFWKEVGSSSLSTISALEQRQAGGEEEGKKGKDEKLFLSTHGGGVAYLHARLDRVPKYYSHHPYRRNDR